MRKKFDFEEKTYKLEEKLEWAIGEAVNFLFKYPNTTYKKIQKLLTMTIVISLSLPVSSLFAFFIWKIIFR